MESVYTQVLNLVETIDPVDNQVEGNSVPRDHFPPTSDSQESSQLFPDIDQRHPLRPPPRSYISSPLPSTASSSLNTFEPDLSLSSKGHKGGLYPHSNHQRVTSGGSRVLFRLPDENGVLSSREKPNIQFASTSTRQSSSSGASSLLLPRDHSRYPLDKFRKLEGFVTCDYDLYEDKEPDPDDWLYAPDPSAPLASQQFALPWRGIANIGFLAVLLIVIIFLFVGLPIYTTIVRGWDV